MLADEQGALRWVTGTNQAEQAFEHERDLGEGPCIDAFTAGRVVRTPGLQTDPRWPRLGPAARTNRIRGVLSAQLQVALSSRVVVEQAKGALMEREGVDAQRAFELLRRRARSSERKLADVAHEVLARRP